MSKSWCFTLNNYTAEDVLLLDGLVPNVCSYLVYGFEFAPTTLTPHLQGYVQFAKQYRMAAVAKLIPRAHVIKAKGTQVQNRVYCTKSNDYKEFGFPLSQG